MVKTETVELPAGAIAAIGQYLADRPWREVAHIMAALEAGRMVEPEEKSPEPESAE